MKNKPETISKALPREEYAATEFGHTQGGLEKDPEGSGIHTLAEKVEWEKALGIN
jgi:hypothetical protein